MSTTENSELSTKVSDDAKWLRHVQDQFILEWARMSNSWGVNRTMAQIHALLLVSNCPMSVDQIIERLQISRGNASMNLREAMDWGIVQRYRRPGERKDLYICETGAWQMLARVVRERKRREIDPTSTALKETLRMVPPEDASPEAALLRERLSGLLQIFAILDLVYDQVFRTDESFQQTLQLFEPKPISE